MSKIRLLRLMEYTYNSVEMMEADQAHWQVQGTYRPNAAITIRSTTLPLEVIPEDPEPRKLTMATCTVHAAQAVAMAVGSVSVRHVKQTVGGTLCPMCLEQFVDNVVTRVITADDFVLNEAGPDV